MSLRALTSTKTATVRYCVHKSAIKVAPMRAKHLVLSTSEYLSVQAWDEGDRDQLAQALQHLGSESAPRV